MIRTVVFRENMRRIQYSRRGVRDFMTNFDLILRRCASWRTTLSGLVGWYVRSERVYPIALHFSHIWGRECDGLWLYMGDEHSAEVASHSKSIAKSQPRTDSFGYTPFVLIKLKS